MVSIEQMTPPYDLGYFIPPRRNHHVAI